MCVCVCVCDIYIYIYIYIYIDIEAETYLRDCVSKHMYIVCVDVCMCRRTYLVHGFWMRKKNFSFLPAKVEMVS